MPTIPIEGGNARFYAGVPFTSDYKHTRWFTSRTQQDSFFSTQDQVYTMNDVKFTGSNANRGNTPYITVSAPYETMYNVNYMSFDNKSYENKRFFAFVTKIEWISPKATRLYFQIDVIQSWMFQIEMQPSYVVREHTREYNADGTPVKNTIDEGLDYGTEYDTVHGFYYQPMEGLQWLVIQATREIHDKDDGDQEINPQFIGAPQPLVTYLVPIDRETSARFPDVTISYIEDRVGRQEFKFTHTVEDILKELYKNDNSVNAIVNLYVTENIGLPVISVTKTVNAYTVTFNTGTTGKREMIGDFSIFRLTRTPAFAYFSSPTYDIYGALTKPPESKLLMSPYTKLVMDDYRGSRQELQVEHLPNGKLTLLAKGSLGSGSKISYAPKDYNLNSDFDSMEYALMSDNTNDLPIINDYTSAYMQGNANSLRNKLDSTAFNGLTSTVGSLINGVGSAGRQQINPLGAGQAVNDLVGTAGNAVLSIQSIDAKMKDINNIPAQLGKMGGNISYSFGNRYLGVRMLVKQIKPEYYRKLQDFFKCFGYKVNRVKVPNLTTRTSFNYVQTESCNIKGKIPNEDLNTLKSIFDNGVTLWHINNVGDYTVSNGVR